MGVRDKLRKMAELVVVLPEASRSSDDFAALEPSNRQGKSNESVNQSSGQLTQADQSMTDKETAISDGVTSTLETKVDFGVIYQQAALPVTPFTAEQVIDILSSLPPELPLKARQQTVKATLNAVGKSVGATSETIVADASRKLEAITAYVNKVSEQTSGLVATEEKEIVAMQAQIEEKRKAIAEAQRRKTEATQICQAEAVRLRKVLEFFGTEQV
jgi:hypothetical protein